MASALALLGLDPTPVPNWPLSVFDAIRNRYVGGSGTGVPVSATTFFPYLTLTFPSPLGTKYFAGVGLSSFALGPIAGKVKAWPSNLKWGFQETQSSLTTERYTIQFDDTDNSWGAIVEGVQAGQIRRAPAQIGLAIPGLPASMWPPLFTGVVEWASYAKPRLAQVVIRRNDFWLNSLLPRRTMGPHFTSVVGSIGKAIPIAIGAFDSTGNFGTAQGAISCLQISTNPNYWLVSIGKIIFSGSNQLVTPNTYFGGVVQGATFTTQTPIIAGLQCTVIQPNSGQTPTSVSVDCSGVDKTGDGTGTAFSTPVDSLLWLLQNFGVLDYTQGLWASPDPTIFDLDGLSDLEDQLLANKLRSPLAAFTGLTGSNFCSWRSCGRLINNQVRAIDELNAWAEAFSCKFFWLPNGLLTARKIGNRQDTQKAYVDRTTHYVNVDAEQIGDTFRQVADPQNVVDWISAPYASDANAGKKQNVMDLRDVFGFAGGQLLLQKASSWATYRTTQTLFLMSTAFGSTLTTQGAPVFTLVQSPDYPTALSVPVHQYVGVPRSPGTQCPQVQISGSATYTGWVRMVMAKLPPLLSISSVTLTVLAKWTSNGGGTPTRVINATYVNPAGTAFNGTAQAGGAVGTWVSYGFVFSTNPSTGVAWTKDDIESGQFGFGVQGAVASGTPDTWLIAGLTIGVSFQSESVTGPFVRDVRSGDLNLLRQPVPITECTLPAHRLAMLPGDLVALSYRLTAAPGGAMGWNPGIPNRRLHMLLSHELDLNEKVLVPKSRFVDMRYLCPTMWENDLCNIETGYLRPGIPILNQTRDQVNPGLSLTRNFTRHSVAYPNDPADNRIIQIAAGLEAYDKQGLRIQGTLLNQTPFSVTFGANWTKSIATGCNIAADTAFTPTPFDSTVVTAFAPQLIKLTMAASIPTADNMLELTTIGSVASVYLIRFCYYNDQGNPFYWCFQRTTDSKWWRDSDQTWQTAKTFNPLTGAADGSVKYFTSHSLGGFTPTSNGFQVAQPGTTNGAGLTVASQTNHIFEIDIWSSRFAGELNPNNLAAGSTRQPDAFTYTCSGDVTVYPGPDWGTWWCLFVPDFNSSELLNGDVAVFLTALSGAGSSSNFDDIRYTASGSGNGTLAFRRSVDGTVTSATFANPVFTRGVPVIIGARWTGLNGELGLANFFQDVFFGTVGNVTKGTGVAGNQQRFAQPYTVVIGADNVAGSAANWSWGFFQIRKGYPACLADAEIQRQPV